MINYHEADRPPVLPPAEIEKLLSMRLIAKLATIDEDGAIHVVPMWFLRVAEDICIPTSRNTQYRNLLKKASSLSCLHGNCI
jgi:nitroimidazol reductase NimA-like FMN-containing flavoprotein (pyridoxamine 5'-phosphate oxidase superfamily)